MVQQLPTSTEHIHQFWIHTHTKNEIFILHMLKRYKKIVPTIFIKQIIMDSYTNEKKTFILQMLTRYTTLAAIRNCVLPIPMNTTRCMTWFDLQK